MTVRAGIKTGSELAKSFRYCRRVARREARNFYYSFLVLPAVKRDALCAVYAFMRYCDDIADTPGAPATKRGFLDAWRDALRAALRGDCSPSPILPAFRATVERYSIPPQLFEELIEGAAMDLSPRRYATFDELHQYCYRVASVVGLVCIRIFGFADGGRWAVDGGGQTVGGSRETVDGSRQTGEQSTEDESIRLQPPGLPTPDHRLPTPDHRLPTTVHRPPSTDYRLPSGAALYAEHMGIAFQLTNILRDLPEDAAMGRIYLPLEDLAAFQYPEADLLAGVVDERFLGLMKFEAQRAQEYYEKARPLVMLVDPSSRPCLAAMEGIYHGILDQIVRQGYNVHAGRARLSHWRKLGVAVAAWVQYGLLAR